MQQEQGHWCLGQGRGTAPPAQEHPSLSPKDPPGGAASPACSSSLFHTGCYPTIPRLTVSRVPVKGNTATTTLVTRQLPLSLQALAITLPIQGTGTRDLPSHVFMWMEELLWEQEPGHEYS